MAHGMIAAQGVIAVTLALVSGQRLAQGQGLSDPMQPPAFAAPPSAAAGGRAGGLQSTLLSKGRRIAMIDGKPMQVGDRIGAAISGRSLHSPRASPPDRR